MGASTKNLDFSNVKEGGNFNKKRIPAGDYLAKITKVEDAPTKEGGKPQYLFSIRIESRPGSVLPYYCQLSDEKQLWKLRNILIAAGKSVPKKKQKIDPNVIVGKLIGVTIGDSEFDDKEQSEIEALFPAAELPEGDAPDDAEVEDDEEEDEDAPLEEDEAEEEEPEEEEEETGDEWDAITDRLELRKALKKVAPDVKTSSSMSEDDIRDLIRKAVASDDDEVEEDEEEEEAPAPKKKVPAKKTKKKSSEVSDDELEELDIDDL